MADSGIVETRLKIRVRKYRVPNVMISPRVRRAQSLRSSNRRCFASSSFRQEIVCPTSCFARVNTSNWVFR